METGQPSRTAVAAAMHRAGHQLVDRPVLFDDPLAVPILGFPEDVLLGHDLIKRAGMRALIVARSLLAEGTLAAAREQGVRQYVLLGAGMDTFAYRNPFPDVAVFEVDHPATQGWKRHRLEQIGADATRAVFAPIDFETETLAEALSRAGFDLAAPAVFAWLGVLPYLTMEAVSATFRAIGAMAKGSQIIFDYGEPAAANPMVAAYVAETRARLAEMGEPILTTFEPAELAALLKVCGFSAVEDLSGETADARFFAKSALSFPSGSIAHIVCAKV